MAATSGGRLSHGALYGGVLTVSILMTTMTTRATAVIYTTINLKPAMETVMVMATTTTTTTTVTATAKATQQST